MKNRFAYLLLLVPLLMVAFGVFVHPFKGSSPNKAKPKKAHVITYSEAGGDLQAGYEGPLKKRGYDFTVVACAKNSKIKFACAATVDQGGKRVACLVINFTDTGGPDTVNIGKAGRAEDKSVCD